MKSGETRLVSIWEENFEGFVCEICPNGGSTDRFLFQKDKIERVGQGKDLPKPENIATKLYELPPPERLEINDFKIWVYPTDGQKPRSGYFFAINDSVLTLRKRMVDAQKMNFEVAKIEKIKIREDRNFTTSTVLGGVFGGIVGGLVGVAVGRISDRNCEKNCGYVDLVYGFWGLRIGAPIGAAIGWASKARKTTFTIEGTMKA